MRTAPISPAVLPADFDAELVILALLGVLRGFSGADRGLMNHIVRGEQHIPTCQAGMWLTPGGPRPEGDPCNERCERAQLAVAWAIAWIWANRPAEIDQEVAG
jgi:hypothetical protein